VHLFPPVSTNLENGQTKFSTFESMRETLYVFKQMTDKKRYWRLAVHDMVNAPQVEDIEPSSKIQMTFQILNRNNLFAVSQKWLFIRLCWKPPFGSTNKQD